MFEYLERKDIFSPQKDANNKYYRKNDQEKDNFYNSKNTKTPLTFNPYMTVTNKRGFNVKSPSKDTSNSLIYNHINVNNDTKRSDSIGKFVLNLNKSPKVDISSKLDFNYKTKQKNTLSSLDKLALKYPNYVNANFAADN